MRFTRSSVCSAELLSVVYDLHAQHGASASAIADEVQRQCGLRVSRASIHNWVRGKVPASLKPHVPPSIASSNDVPRGTPTPLEWVNVPAFVIRRSACGFYEILRTGGRKGERFLAQYLEGDPKRTQRLFAMRATLPEALADAEHHHQTGGARL